MTREPVSNRASVGVAMVVMRVLLPLLLGGCPEFRNDMVSAVDTATRGIINAALDLLFNQFRNNNVSYASPLVREPGCRDIMLAILIPENQSVPKWNHKRCARRHIRSANT